MVALSAVFPSHIEIKRYDMNRNKPFVIGKTYSNEQYTMDLLDGKLFINLLAVFGIGKL